MKLTLKISAAIVVLLLISVYGYLQIREFRSYQNQVAQNARIVYKLNVDGLVEAMAADFSGNPGYYLKTNENGAQRPGFSFPANIFVYSLKTKAATTFFSRLGLTDTTGLKDYLRAVLKINDFTKAGGKDIGTSADHRMTVAYDGEHLALAYSFSKEAVMEEVKEILDQKNRMEANAPLMVALKKARGHFSWTTLEYGGQVNFKEGRAEIDGHFPTEGLEIPDQPRFQVKFTDAAIMRIWLNAGIRTGFLPKELPLKVAKLQSDTLLKAYQGFASLEMGSVVTQVDSLIGYEYNDDFEKVETVQLKKVTVPHLKFMLTAKTGELLTYLRGKTVLSANNRFNKELFPLYQVFSTAHQDLWQLSTLEKDPISKVSVRSDNFFSASIDFNAIKAGKQFPLFNRLLKPFSHLRMTATKVDEKSAILIGEVGFQQKNINAFIQLFQ